MQATLIDRNVYSTFQPLLYEVATAGLTSSDVAFPARSVTRGHRAAFRHGELTSIDADAGRVTLADGTRFGYDYLILATGRDRICWRPEHGLVAAARNYGGGASRRVASAVAGIA